MTNDDWLMGALAAQDAYRGDEPAWPPVPPSPMGALAAQPDVLIPPPRNPARMPQGVEDFAKGTVVDPFVDAAKAVRGQMTPEEQRDFALTAGIGLLSPMARGVAKPTGIRAYHSSPHDFERFDMSKIGTGQGAQSYGHGIYMAENPAVSGGPGSEYYKEFLARSLGNDPVAHRAYQYLQSHGYDRQKAASAIDDFLERGVNKDNTKAVAELNAARDRLASGAQVGPRTYEVNIAARPEQFLDWDRPLSKQPEAIQRLAAESPPRLSGNTFRQNELVEPLGEDFYRRLASMKGNTGAPKVLQGYDVPGIRYLDQGSRNAKDFHSMQRGADGKIYTFDEFGGRLGVFDTVAEAKASKTAQTSNYVLFDDKIIDILRKYGLAGLAPAGMGALAAQDRYAQ